MNVRTDLQGPGRFNRRAVKVDDAQASLLAAVEPLAATETVPLWQAAGRVLAEPLAATTDWPPFARSGMDGFAVRAADIAHATPESPAVLRVTETVGAGCLARGPVLPGTAVRIMTGAAVPEGADTVVMLEMTAESPAAGGGQRVDAGGAAHGIRQVGGSRTVDGGLNVDGAEATACVERVGTGAAMAAEAESGEAKPGGEGAGMAESGEAKPAGEGVEIAGSGEAKTGGEGAEMAESGKAKKADGGAAPETLVAVKQPVEIGRNVARAGEEFRRGDAVAATGTVVRPGHVALFGVFGYAEVRVFRRPRVAVFATGTELLPVGAPLEPGRIRDSNSAFVAALAMESGADAQPLGCLPDDPDAVAAALTSALDWADAVITTGGVSVGDFDVMAAILARLESEASRGSRVVFNKIAMRPGSPTSAAIFGGKPLLALSGNPAACFVGFHLFARPVIRRLLGDPQPLRPERTAELASAAGKPSPHERFIRVRLFERDGRLYADQLGFDKSGMTASLPEAEALARIPAGSQGAAAGSTVRVITV